MTTLWIVIQTVVDTLILIVVLFYFFERKKRIKEEQNAELRKRELEGLVKSLDQLMIESERSSIDISDKVLESQKKIHVLLDQLENKKEELKIEREEAILILDKFAKQLEIIPDEKKSILSIKDKYSKAAHLAKSGLNVEEISRKLDLPKGEVELILDLPLRKSKKT